MILISLRLKIAVVTLFVLGAVSIWWSHDSATAALLYVTEGEITYIKKEKEKSVGVSDDPTLLSSGSKLSTRHGKGHIIFPDGSLMSLDQETEVVITFTLDRTSIQQLIGRTWHRVVRLSGSGSYEVITPTAVAAVRGTRFGVDVVTEKGKPVAKVYVTENTVAVTQIIEQQGEIIYGEEELVSIGEVVEVQEADTSLELEVEEIPLDTLQTEWFEENIKLDEQVDEIKSETVEDIHEAIEEVVEEHVEEVIKEAIPTSEDFITPEPISEEEIEVLEPQTEPEVFHEPSELIFKAEPTLEETIIEQENTTLHSNAGEL